MIWIAGVHLTVIFMVERLIYINNAVMGESNRHFRDNYDPVCILGLVRGLEIFDGQNCLV